MQPSKHLLAFAVCSALLPTGVMANEQDSWQFGASIYGWFPDISGLTSFTPPSGGGDFEIVFDQTLENVKFTFKGAFDVRKRRTGFFYPHSICWHAYDWVYVQMASNKKPKTGNNS